MPEITPGEQTLVSNTTMKSGFSASSAKLAFVVIVQYWIMKITRKCPLREDSRRKNILQILQ